MTATVQHHDPLAPPKQSILQQPRAVWAVAFACVIAFMGIGLAHLRTSRPHSTAEAGILTTADA